MKRCRLVISRTSGRSASAGNVGMRSTSALTSLSARLMSVPALNSAMTDASPSEAIAVTRSRPSTPRICSSTRRTIDSSISSAPG